LLCSKLGIAAQMILSDNPQMNNFKGSLIENFVANALASSGFDCYYWESEGKAEVDFVIQTGAGECIPVEENGIVMIEYKIKDLEKNAAARLNESDVAYALINKTVDSRCLLALKEETGIGGEMLSGWLHITSKTLRSYLTRKVSLSETVGEQVLLLTSLFRLGIVVFGSAKAFEVWLTRENSMLDGFMPVDLLGSVSGIRLIESRLYGIEYGDNA